MFKIRHPIPGEPPGALRLREESSRSSPIITLIEYDENELEERSITDRSELLAHLDNEKVTWINIDGLGDIDVLGFLGQRFHLHPLALEDVLDTGQRPKAEQFDDYLFIVTQMLYLDAQKQMCGEQVSMFLGKRFLITLQEEGEFDVFEPVRARICSSSGRIRRAGPDYLAYRLLDSIIDHYYPVLENIGSSIEAIEEEQIENPMKESIRILNTYKRTLAQIRRCVWPTRDVMSSLLHDETGFIQAETRVFLRDCYDHVVQLMDLVESYRDVISGLMEVYLSNVSIRTNEIMRVLTVISSVFIPLTFIAGVYGMNFASEANGRPMPWNMPELHHPLGYAGCLLFMLMVAMGQLAYFKRRGWL
jgi:magnesium transporter